MNKRSVFSILAFVLSFYLSGCAGSGEYVQIQDPAALQKIKRVYLPYFPAQFRKDKEDSSGVTSVATNAVMTFLHERLSKLFVTIFADGTDPKNTARNIEDARHMGREYRADGIIFAELIYPPPDNPFFSENIMPVGQNKPPLTRQDAYLKLTLLEASTGNAIAVIEFDTKEGKIYPLRVHPPLEPATRDAIIGCVDALERAIKGESND